MPGDFLELEEVHAAAVRNNIDACMCAVDELAGAFKKHFGFLPTHMIARIDEVSVKLRCWSEERCMATPLQQQTGRRVNGVGTVAQTVAIFPYKCITSAE